MAMNCKKAVAVPVRCSRQGIDKALVAPAMAIKIIILIYNFIITTFDCQGDNQGGVISAGHLPWHALVWCHRPPLTEEMWDKGAYQERH